MTERADLAEYVRTDLRGEAVYRGYRPRAPILEQVQTRLPNAHVLIVSGAWCIDCRREVPKFARIMEQLPAGWTVELRQDDDVTRDTFGVRSIPSFIVMDQPGGRELGRIIESPASPDGLEGDLVAIAEAVKAVT